MKQIELKSRQAPQKLFYEALFVYHECRYQAPTALISKSRNTELHFSYLLRSDSKAGALKQMDLLPSYIQREWK